MLLKNIFGTNISKIHNVRNDMALKFNLYICLILGIICLGNGLYMFREILFPRQSIFWDLISRLIPTIFIIVSYTLRNRFKKFFAYTGLLAGLIGGICAMLTVFFVRTTKFHSCEGEILYYTVSGLALAPVAFSIKGELLAVLSCIVYTYLLYLAGPGGMCPDILNTYLPVKIIATGWISFFLGQVISFALHIAYFNNSESNKRLKEALNIDPLTKVYSRYWIKNHDKINNCILGIIDVDKFKQINDTFGHDIGDFVLESNANIISSYLNKTESMARFGGDEFILILDKDRDVEEFRTDITNALEGFYKNMDVKSTVSLGYTFVEKETSIEEAMVIADKFLYENKRNK